MSHLVVYFFVLIINSDEDDFQEILNEYMFFLCFIFILPNKIYSESSILYSSIIFKFLFYFN